MKFYVVALLFIVFDVEAVFVYPWAVLLQGRWAGPATPPWRSSSSRSSSGLVYVWKKGALDWAQDRSHRWRTETELRARDHDAPRGGDGLLPAAGVQGAGLGAQVLALPVPVRHRLLRHGVHGVSSARYDIARFGAEVPRFSPRQADLLMVVGTVNCKQAPILQRVYEQMASRSGSSPSASAPARAASTRTTPRSRASTTIIPVDVYIPGCPPRPEQVLDGLMLLQQKIQGQNHRLIDRPVRAEAIPAAEPVVRRGSRMAKAVIDALTRPLP